MNGLIKWFRSFFATTNTDRERGVEYAKERLAGGCSQEELLIEAENPFDFNDFDRGILDHLDTLPWA